MMDGSGPGQDYSRPKISGQEEVKEVVNTERGWVTKG